MGRIVLVSNRVMDPAQAAQAGGVAVALSDVLQSHGGLWFGWSGTIEPEVTNNPEITRINDRVAMATVPLTPSEHQGYYLGYANSVLWPVFHNRLDLAQFQAGFFEVYTSVNRRLAKCLKPLLQPDDTIWVHDYQLVPLAWELRALDIDNPIGFFLHIPFPPAQTFFAVPEHKLLARFLSAYDLIGLQTQADVANLLEYLKHGVRGRILQDGRIRVFDQVLSIGSFPVSIDPKEFVSAKPRYGLAQGGPTVRRIIGVDRLDYTKGLPQKFHAFARFLEKYPANCGSVVLTQIAPPTRESVEAYADIRTELETLAGSINGRFGELDWVPIHYIHRPLSRSLLGDIYRSARIGLVTPMRDGMNLVAKEYVAAQDPTDPGVLILSRFAGAAEQLTNALIVNPYNVDEIADAIEAALQMGREERVRRNAELLEGIIQRDTFAWSRAFLDALSNARAQHDSATGGPPPDELRNKLRQLARRAGRRDPSSREKGGRERDPPGNNSALQHVDRPLGQR
ncbi:MAG TPA: trehalose-6-phosphate synthase [Hyphomicrobiaceae bacterium]|nr:trehalose-6-phosphate synthase [Hyphomicrobiaceae bacterium]